MPDSTALSGARLLKILTAHSRIAYTVTALKNWSFRQRYISERKIINNPYVSKIRESVCQNQWQGHKVRLAGLGNFEVIARK